MWRHFWMVVFSAGALFTMADIGASAEAARKYRVYIGTYTGPGSRGIYQTTLDVATGQLLPAQLAAEIVSPSFLAIHPSQKYLYAVNEVTEFENKPTGAVTAFAIDENTGALRALNQQPSEGTHPCHLIVDAAGKNVLVANYTSGSVAVLPIDPASGRIAAASSKVQHAGSSINKQRQEGPHAHSINLDAANRFALVADLGLDAVKIYRFDSAAAALAPHTAEGVVAKGGGPRHLAFHPSGKFAFVNNELSSTVTVFRYDSTNGSLVETHTLSTLPTGFTGENSTAETAVHPTGNAVYVSNRGHDSIAVFSFDSNSGMLTAKGHTATGGKTPRNFAIEPTGAFLLAANQTTNTIVVFRIDPTSGGLTDTGVKIEVGSPVCIRFLPLKS